MTKGALRKHKTKANLHRDCSVGCPGFGLLGARRVSVAEEDEEEDEEEEKEDYEGEEARTKSGHPCVRCPHSCGCGNYNNPSAGVVKHRWMVKNNLENHTKSKLLHPDCSGACVGFAWLEGNAGRFLAYHGKSGAGEINPIVDRRSFTLQVLQQKPSVRAPDERGVTQERSAQSDAAAAAVLHSFQPQEQKTTLVPSNQEANDDGVRVYCGHTCGCMGPGNVTWHSRFHPDFREAHENSAGRHPRCSPACPLFDKMPQKQNESIETVPQQTESDETMQQKQTKASEKMSRCAHSCGCFNPMDSTTPVQLHREMRTNHLSRHESNANCHPVCTRECKAFGKGGGAPFAGVPSDFVLDSAPVRLAEESPQPPPLPRLFDSPPASALPDVELTAADGLFPEAGLAPSAPSSPLPAAAAPTVERARFSDTPAVLVSFSPPSAAAAAANSLEPPKELRDRSAFYVPCEHECGCILWQRDDGTGNTAHRARMEKTNIKRHAKNRKCHPRCTDKCPAHVRLSSAPAASAPQDASSESSEEAAQVIGEGVRCKHLCGCINPHYPPSDTDPKVIKRLSSSNMKKHLPNPRCHPWCDDKCPAHAKLKPRGPRKSQPSPTDSDEKEEEESSPEAPAQPLVRCKHVCGCVAPGVPADETNKVVREMTSNNMKMHQPSPNRHPWCDANCPANALLLNSGQQAAPATDSEEEEEEEESLPAGRGPVRCVHKCGCVNPHRAHDEGKKVIRTMSRFNMRGHQPNPNCHPWCDKNCPGNAKLRRRRSASADNRKPSKEQESATEDEAEEEENDEDSGPTDRVRCPHSCGCGNYNNPGIGVEKHRKISVNTLGRHQINPRLHARCSLATCHAFKMLEGYRPVGSDADTDETDDEVELLDASPESQEEESKDELAPEEVRCPHSCGCVHPHYATEVHRKMHRTNLAHHLKSANIHPRCTPACAAIAGKPAAAEVGPPAAAAIARAAAAASARYAREAAAARAAREASARAAREAAARAAREASARAAAAEASARAAAVARAARLAAREDREPNEAKYADMEEDEEEKAPHAGPRVAPIQPAASSQAAPSVPRPPARAPVPPAAQESRKRSAAVEEEKEREEKASEEPAAKRPKHAVAEGMMALPPQLPFNMQIEVANFTIHTSPQGCSGGNCTVTIPLLVAGEKVYARCSGCGRSVAVTSR
jgi:hypothetical protein